MHFCTIEMNLTKMAAKRLKVETLSENSTCVLLLSENLTFFN